MSKIPLTPEQLHSHQVCVEHVSSAANGLYIQDDAVLAAHANERAVEGHSVVTIIGPAITLYQLQCIADALQQFGDLGPFKAHSLSGKYGETAVTANMIVSLEDGLRDTVSELANKFRVEVGIAQNAPSLNSPGLLVMDMDSTVIQIECIDEIAKLAGVGDKVAAVTEQAMQGKLDFNESLYSRVGCLTGVKEAQLQQIRDSIPLMPGVVILLQELKQRGWKLAIASGGFTYFAQHLQQRLGLDASFANVLEVQDGELTGHVIGEVVNADVKAKVVRDLAKQWNIPLSQTIAMGDGANDLVMMAQSALGIAHHAKPIVAAKADVAVRYGGLDRALYYLQS